MPEEADFPCGKCGKLVQQNAVGTRNRNHCPHCLWSLHVANERTQDDRTSTCHGLMEPIAISTQRDGEWSLVHRCEKCSNVKTNRIAGDDDTILLLCLALQPLANLPFPLDSVHLEAMTKYRNQ